MLLKSLENTLWSYLKLHYGSITSFKRNETWESGRGTELRRWRDSSTAGNCAAASKHQNPFASNALSHGQSISKDSANPAYLLPGLFKPLLTTRYETRPLRILLPCFLLPSGESSACEAKQGGQRKPGRGASLKLASLWCILTFSYLLHFSYCFWYCWGETDDIFLS